MDFLLPILNTLALAAVAILLMVGLIESPWQLLLLILVVATLLSQWLIRRSHLQNVLNDLENPETTAKVSPRANNQQVEKPVLSYRGANYSQSRSISDGSISDGSTTPLEIVGKYRGGLWRSGS